MFYYYKFKCETTFKKFQNILIWECDENWKYWIHHKTTKKRQIMTFPNVTMHVFHMKFIHHIQPCLEIELFMLIWVLFKRAQHRNLKIVSHVWVNLQLSTIIEKRPSRNVIDKAERFRWQFSRPAKKPSCKFLAKIKTNKAKFCVRKTTFLWSPLNR